MHERLISKLERRERLDADDALTLMTGSFPVGELMAYAHEARLRRHPEGLVTFVYDTNPNYTNVCVTHCEFCAFWRSDKAKDAYTLAPDELARCEPFLVRQIELLKPRIILAMGRFAVQALLRSDEPIGRLRGRVHRYQGVPLVVTYHPAYLLRNLPEKAKAWDDLCLAAEVFERPPAG